MKRCIGIAVAACLLTTSAPLAAQSPQLGFRGGVGLESLGATARARLLGDRLGGFVEVGLRRFNVLCLTSLPAFCDRPSDSAREISGGVVFRGREVPLYAAVGGGTLSWNDVSWLGGTYDDGAVDRFWSLEVGATAGLASALILDIGIQALLAPGVRYESARQIVDTDVELLQLVVGLYVG